MSALSRPNAVCAYCHRPPDQIEEYSPEMTGTQMSAEDYVWREEGTLNRENGHFACTFCYLKIGAPSSRFGWVAP